MPTDNYRIELSIRDDAGVQGFQIDGYDENGAIYSVVNSFFDNTDGVWSRAATVNATVTGSGGVEYNTVNPASHPADVLSDCEAIFGP